MVLVAARWDLRPFVYTSGSRKETILKDVDLEVIGGMPARKCLEL